MTVTTMLQQIYSKREVNLVTYLTHILAQSRLVEELHLPLYIFIHEVSPGSLPLSGQALPRPKLVDQKPVVI